MNVGLVWPTPGPEGRIDTHALALAKDGTGATHLRFNLDYRHPDPVGLVTAVRDHGFTPLPILDFYPYTHHADLGAFVAFSQRVVAEAQLPEVELLNEPRVMGGWTGERYARFVRPVCMALKGQTRLMLAGDYLQPDRKGPKIFPAWFDAVTAMLWDVRYDVVAWHTYREPAPPDTTRYTDRQAEYVSMRRPLPSDLPVQVTEVGWNIHSEGMTLDLQAEYLARELTINRDLGIEATYLYAPVPGDATSDFGLFHHNWTPRPAAEAVRAWIAGQA